MKKATYYILPSFALLGLALGFILHISGSIGLDNKVWMVTIIIGTIPLIWKILKDIFSGHFGIDLIAIIAIITSFVLGQYLAGNIILLMLSGGEALEMYALKRARKELSSLISNAPTFAHIKKDGNLLDVDVHEVKVKDLILIKTGEIIPADGIVILGKSQVDESALTGESLPAEKGIGSSVFSGSVNKSDILEVEVIRLPSESKYEQIIKLVKQAEENRAPVVRLADKYSVWFTIITFGLAALAWFLAKDSVRLLAVLVVATPCPLILATPIAMISGISRAAKRSIIVKNGGALEVLAETNAFIFDKTGTLTLGQPEIIEVISFGKEKNEVLRISASLDQLSLHVLARSLQNYALKNNIALTIPTNFRENFGEGVSGDIEDQIYFFGKLKFLERNGINISKEVFERHLSFQEKGQIAVYAGNKDGVLGIVVFADIVRPETKSLFSDLKKNGLEKIVMLTGDKKSVAEIISKQLEIDDIHAEALPENKVFEVQDHQRQFGKVAMIGDGVNDAPALATADVGISMGQHGSSASSDSSDIVIMVDNLDRVGEAYIIAKKTLKIAKQGIFFGIGVSIILMIFAAFGYISPIYGALIQEGLDVIVILNALRVSFA
ncbi:MAG: heavy metal translocating P-type ATPase [Candidatus Nomurabacteria bacterium]|nr:heavy metal translocating P-type ATPase [Candidatus Nomurabacteria bacterium]